MPRLPADAFERFMQLGPGRSYSKLAGVLGCSKRSVTARAAKEGWQQRLSGIEADARSKSDQKLAETTAAINDRHLRTLRAVQGKALQALTSAPMGTAAQAAATLIAAVRAERAIVSPPDSSGSGVGESFADLLRASLAVPPERVEELRRQLGSTSPTAQSPPDRVATPGVFGEN